MDGERKQIVVVDDEPTLAQLFCDGLQSAGFKAKEFDDPEAAMEYVSMNHPKIALVITDWRMPKINGLGLAKAIRQIDDEIKIMLMSAYELEQDQLKETEKDDYLKKPIHMAKLIETVKKELRELPYLKQDSYLQ
jgi:DNA-binding response OmpR family regulator